MDDVLKQVLTELKAVNRRLGSLEDGQGELREDQKAQGRELKSVGQHLDRLEKGQNTLIGRVGNLEEGQIALIGRVGNLEEGQVALIGRVGNLEEGQDTLIERVANLGKGQDSLIGRVGSLEEGQVELRQGQKTMAEDLTRLAVHVEGEITEKIKGLYDTRDTMLKSLERIEENQRRQDSRLDLHWQEIQVLRANRR